MQIGLNMSLSGLRTLDPAASVRALFTNDEPGVWFEANDASTLFTDVAGTTPVTTPGDAVALQLDKSQGLTLGPELVTNGTFDTDVSGWDADANGTISWDNGTLKYTGTGAGPTFMDASQTLSTIVGQRYRVSFELTALSPTNPIRCVVTGTSDVITVNDSGVAVGDFIATNTSTLFKIGIVGGVLGETFNIDNISVRELPGNHRTQATTAARPLYALHPVGGVRNKLEYTEEFDNAVWVGDRITKNSSTLFTATASNGVHAIIQSFSCENGQDYTFRSKLKYENNRFVSLRIFAGIFPHVCFDLINGTIAGTQSGALGTIEDLGNGEYLCTITVTATTTGTGNACIFLQPDATNYGSAWTALGTEQVTAKEHQLEEGSTATNYQKVRSFLDVSEEGKARRGRLWYNGTSHFMETGTITPGTDKVQVFAGVRKLSDAAAGILIESSTISETSNGAFGIAAPGSFAKVIAISRGTIIRTAGTTDAAYNAPTTRVVSTFGDISGDRVALHIDGTQVAQSTESQGTGNYLAYPIYFGARAGTSLFYNGYEDTSIIRFGPNLDDTTISKVESYVASKTPEPTL